MAGHLGHVSASRLMQEKRGGMTHRERKRKEDEALQFLQECFVNSNRQEQPHKHPRDVVAEMTCQPVTEDGSLYKFSCCQMAAQIEPVTGKTRPWTMAQMRK